MEYLYTFSTRMCSHFFACEHIFRNIVSLFYKYPGSMQPLHKCLILMSEEKTYLWIRNCARCLCPHVDAAWSGVHNSLSVTLASAPFSISILIIASLLSIHDWKQNHRRANTDIIRVILFYVTIKMNSINNST